MTVIDHRNGTGREPARRPELVHAFRKRGKPTRRPLRLPDGSRRNLSTREQAHQDQRSRPPSSSRPTMEQRRALLGSTLVRSAGRFQGISTEASSLRSSSRSLTSARPQLKAKRAAPQCAAKAERECCLGRGRSEKPDVLASCRFVCPCSLKCRPRTGTSARPSDG